MSYLSVLPNSVLQTNAANTTSRNYLMVPTMDIVNELQNRGLISLSRFYSTKYQDKKGVIGMKDIFYFEFYGRENGAIGITHPCDKEVRAETYDQAYLALYETHEHIHDVHCTRWREGKQVPVKEVTL